MKEKVLEIEIKKINEEYSVWWLKYLNEKIDFDYNDLNWTVFLENGFTRTGTIFIGNPTKPSVILNDDVSYLLKTANTFNEKYGIEKFEIDKVSLYEKYFYITDFFKLRKDKNAGHDLDKERYDCYNHFINEEECEWCASKMKDYLLELRKEWRENNGAK